MYTVDRLLGGGPATDAKATIDYPLEHLVACHNRIEERLAILERAAAHLESKPDEARAALFSVIRYFETSGVLHTRDEEESVFPRLESRLSPEDREYLAALEADHREADALFESLRRVPEPGAAAAPYREAVVRFCALYRAHIATENERLIALGRRVLDESELAAVSAEMKRRRNLG